MRHGQNRENGLEKYSSGLSSQGQQKKIHVASFTPQKMVVFDFIICDGLFGCPVVPGSSFWFLMTSIVDAIVIVASLNLILGHKYGLILAIAGNYAINLAFKTATAVPRQFANCGCGFAMPSGHAQLIAALWVVYIWMDWHWSHGKPLYMIWHGIVATTGATLVCVSRGVLGFHTGGEVVVGVVVGLLYGSLVVVFEAMIVPACCPGLIAFKHTPGSAFHTETSAKGEKAKSKV